MYIIEIYKVNTIWYCIPYYEFENKCHGWGSQFKSASKMTYNYYRYYIHGSINYNLDYNYTGSAWNDKVGQSLVLGNNYEASSTSYVDQGELYYYIYYRFIMYYMVLFTIF